MRRLVAAIGLAMAFPATVLLAQTAPVAAPPAATAPAAVAPEARPPKIPAQAFAKKSGFEGMAISPDGALIATNIVIAGQVNIAILDSVTHKAQDRIAIPKKNELEWYRWAGSSKLLISLSSVATVEGEDYQVTRLYLFVPATNEFSVVGKKDMGFIGNDLLYTDPDGQYVLLAMQNSVYDYPSIWRFPLDGTAMKSGKEVQAARTGVWDWYADNKGVVRWGVEVTLGKKYKYWYRRTAGEKFRIVGKLDADYSEDDAFDIERIIGESDEGYVLKKDDSGRVALRKFNYATRTAGETVAAVPGWDVDEVVYDRDDKPIAITYTDDRDRVVWLDPVLKQTQARLERAMKGSDVWLSSRARDQSRILVWVGHEDDPGGMYLFDAAKRTLDPIYGELPLLEREALVAPKPIAYKARDGSEIKGYLTLPRGRDPRKLPLILLPHGGPYGIRDKLQYDSEVQFLANRGYAVLQPNYRGSGGYGEDFDELGRGQIGRKMQDDIDDAMDWAVKEGLADAARVCVVGSSYGGYAALWAVNRNPERYRCAASFAGVVDWKRLLKYHGSFLSAKRMKKWRAQATGEEAGFDFDQVSPAIQVARLTRPVLLAHGDEDTRVPFKQFKQMRDAAAKAGKPIETIVFEGEGHGFDKEENEQKWLESLEAFLAKNNPAD